ncbi:MAG: hypothetical protein ACRCTA_05875 [Bacilli bacterium]
MKIFNFKEKRKQDLETTKFLQENRPELEKNDILAMVLAFIIVSLPVVLIGIGIILLFFFLLYK